jgi:putative phage-type endonuclease
MEQSNQIVEKILGQMKDTLLDALDNAEERGVEKQNELRGPAELEQNTKTWLKWRQCGLGASDGPIMLGVSPYKTTEELYQEKIADEVTEWEGNFATQRGQRVEPIVRAKYELQTGNEMPAEVAEHPDYPWMRASLDGYSKELNGALEIKCVGVNNHEDAVNGRVPPHYIPQLQHQFFVTGVAWIDYVSYHIHHGDPEDSGHMKIVRVTPDLPYIETYFAKARAFWARVQKHKASVMQDKLNQLNLEIAELEK